MLTTRLAHTLLRAAGTTRGLEALARAIGFTGPEHTLGSRPLATLGLDRVAGVSAVRITRGDDIALLLVDGLREDRWRDMLHHLASRLDRLTDHRRWLVMLRCADSHSLSFACWLGSTKGPRLAVLTTQHDHVLDSDAQTIAALSASWHEDATTTCLRWHDLLGRHAIGRRFFRALETHVTDIASHWPARVHADDRRTLALIHVARLLFLKFLETKCWLNRDRSFLARHADALLTDEHSIWQRLIAPLTFGTLNTPRSRRAPVARQFGDIPFLNGGLFACAPIEVRSRRPAISNALLAPLLLDTLGRYRFTAREEAQGWQEAAIDPDLLGRTFETLMDSAQRKGSGTFYTPATLVNTLVDDALEHTLAAPRELTRAALAGHTLREPDRRRLRQALEHIRVLDPACGSGSLLVATLERLGSLRQAAGDTRPVSSIRRDVLTSAIFGVDIAPIAVWICELRLWLSVVIDDETDIARDIAPLPNLDHHIRIGDSLGRYAFDGSPLPRSTHLAALRLRYAQSAGARKKTLARRIDTLERQSADLLTSRAIASVQQERGDMLRLARQPTLFGSRQGASAAQRRRLSTLRTELQQLRRTLRRLRDGGAIDFDFRTHFADAASAGGFDLVIGNPPWVRPHHLDVATREHLRAHFRTVTSHASAGAAFGVQTDLAIPFTHRALQLTRPSGVLAFLLPAKLWRSVGAGALRRELLEHSTPLLLRDYSATAAGFAAAVYPSAIVVRRPSSAASGAVTMIPDDLECHATDPAGTLRHFHIPIHALPASTERGAPWRLIPPDVREAADRLARAGGRWGDTTLPSPTLGIKTGCNDAFLLAGASEAALHAALQPWARPVLRGDQVRAWHPPELNARIIIPHDVAGKTLTRLPAPLARHFAPFERELLARTDLRPREPWWSLFRTELLSAAGWRVVWADIGKTLRASILPPQSPVVPLNTCYGVRLHDAVDALALAALLNAPTTSAWLSLIAEPARGGYHRFMGWTVLALPLPPWQHARELLAPLAARTRRGESVSIETLHQTTLRAYGLTHADVAPLLAWTASDLRAVPRTGDLPLGPRHTSRRTSMPHLPGTTPHAAAIPLPMDPQ
jgi:hypothetical protein